MDKVTRVLATAQAVHLEKKISKNAFSLVSMLYKEAVVSTHTVSLFRYGEAIDQKFQRVISTEGTRVKWSLQNVPEPTVGHE